LVSSNIVFQENNNIVGFNWIYELMWTL
jgi:hypothetical protein